MDDVTFGRNGRDAERRLAALSDGDKWGGDTGAESDHSDVYECLFKFVTDLPERATNYVLGRRQTTTLRSRSN